MAQHDVSGNRQIVDLRRPKPDWSAPGRALPVEAAPDLVTRELGKITHGLAIGRPWPLGIDAPRRVGKGLKKHMTPESYGRVTVHRPSSPA